MSNRPSCDRACTMCACSKTPQQRSQNKGTPQNGNIFSDLFPFQNTPPHPTHPTPPHPTPPHPPHPPPTPPTTPPPPLRLGPWSSALAVPPRSWPGPSAAAAFGSDAASRRMTLRRGDLGGPLWVGRLGHLFLGYRRIWAVFWVQADLGRSWLNRRAQRVLPHLAGFSCCLILFCMKAKHREWHRFWASSKPEKWWA